MLRPATYCSFFLLILINTIRSDLTDAEMAKLVADTIAAGPPPCIKINEECIESRHGEEDRCCKPGNKDGHEYGICTRGQFSSSPITCQAAQCVKAPGEPDDYGRGGEEKRCSVVGGPLCCDPNLTCIENSENNFMGKCLNKSGLCIPGISQPGSGVQCLTESTDIKKKCCTLSDSHYKFPGKCVESYCKCIADGEECTIDDVCCNEGKDTLSCREGKCQSAGKENERAAYRDDFYSGGSDTECHLRTTDPSKTCCGPGDNAEKQSGTCSDARCFCIKDGDTCTDGWRCCNEGKNGRACRNVFNGAWGSPRKCLLPSDVKTNCRTAGQRCRGMGFGFDPCCEGHACQQQDNRCELIDG